MNILHRFLCVENIISDNRISFTTENLAKYMVVNFFFN